MSVFEILFWIFLAVVFYTYVGYGILLYFLVRVKEYFAEPEKKYDSDKGLPDVTLLIAAYNEENIVEKKMANTMMMDYPAEKLKIIWITDGSTDRTNSILSAYENIEVHFNPKREGKAAAINRAMSFVNTPLVIFTDANAMIDRDSVSEMVKAFRNPKVGCVAGEKRIDTKSKGSVSSGGEGVYWRYESFLKRLDSRFFTTVGAAGELFAIRRELYEPIERDTLLDDFVLSMRIVQRGYKIEYCSRACALEEGSANLAEEKKRKVRIAAGGVQSVIRLKSLLNPFKYTTASFQYVSHRVLRWTITPILLFALLPLNLYIVAEGGAAIYSTLLIFQVLFYLLAVMGKTQEHRKTGNRFLLIPLYFLFMNTNVVRGFWYLIRKKKGDGTWEKAERLNTQQSDQ